MNASPDIKRISGWRWLAAWLMGLLLAASLAACGSVAPAQSELTQAEAETEAEAISENVTPVAAERGRRVDHGELRISRPMLAKDRSTLGTQWGEVRDSVSKSVKAWRVSEDRPREVRELHYSDEDSIRRSLGEHAQRHKNMLLADGDVELYVLDYSGGSLPIYVFRNHSFHLAGSKGERYELLYVNRSQRIYEVVATVDGLDVVSGRPGSIKNRGYLLHPGKTLVIDGFRKNPKEVAAFRFTEKNKGRTYAGNTPAGNVRNVGVIGTALFEVNLGEKVGKESEWMKKNNPKAFPADGGTFAPPPQYSR